MSFYKCGDNIGATMSSRIAGLISMCFVLFLSFPITGFPTRYFEARNIPREKQSSKRAIYSEKIDANFRTKPPYAMQTADRNDTEQYLLESKGLAVLPSSNFDIINSTPNLLQSSSTNEINISPLSQDSIQTQKEFQMINPTTSTDIPLPNCLNLTSLDNKTIFKKNNDPFFYKTKSHDLRRSNFPFPLPNINKKNKSNIGIQSPSIIPTHVKFNNSQHILKKYSNGHQTSYKNLSIKEKYDISNPSALPLSLTTVMQIETTNESKITDKKNTDDILEHNLQYFPSTLGYIFRTILQNERTNNKNISKNQTDYITRSQNVGNFEDMKTSLFGYLTRMQGTEQSDVDYDILENSAVKFILNRKVPNKKSLVNPSKAPFIIYSSDSSPPNINKSILKSSSESLENIHEHRKDHNLSDILNNHKIVYDTTKQMQRKLSTVPSIINVPKFSQTFIGEDNTLDNDAFDKVHKTTENQLLKPIFNYLPKYHDKSQLDNANNDLQIITITEPVDADFSSRKSKMSNRNKSHKMSTAYMQESSGLNYDGGINEFSIPEFHPGTLLHFPENFPRRPIYEVENKFTLSSSNPRSNQNKHIYYTKNKAITSKGNTFEQSSDELNAIGSTFFPFRMEDVSMQFADKGASITKTSITKSFDIHTQRTNVKISDNNKDEEDTDDDYNDIRETSLTMETLAYFLIGTCCGLSILCLCIVVAAIKCRRSLVERRVRRQFRSKLFYPHTPRHPKISASVWQQQFLDQFIYHRDEKQPNSSCSSRDTCNCKCVTWSLGVRNLDTQPICPAQNSVYLCGRKRLPFGAASTLQYESMLGRRRQMSPPRHLPPSPPKAESSNENDSLDEDFVTEPIENTCPKQCTCIGPAAWRLHEGPSIYNAYPVTRSNPIQQHIGNFRDRRELRYIARDCPPPVSGLNYLDRAEGVVYWTSNEERLI